VPPVPAGQAAVPNPLEQLGLAELRRRTSIKWRTYPEDVLPLWVAEMDVVLAEPVQDALVTAVRDGDTGYPCGAGYAQAVAGFAADRWGWGGVDVERTALVPDVMQGIIEVLRLVTAPGDAVVVNCPVYPPFYAFLETAGRQVREVPLAPPTAGHGHRLDLAALEESFARPVDGRRPTAYLLCSPHNPTGTVHSVEELAAVAGLAQEHGVRVVVDEIHAPLVLPGAQFVPYLSVPGAEAGFSVTSGSKGWNLAGLKAALVLAGPAAADDLARLPEVVGHGPSHLGVIAHSAAFSGGRPWLDALLAGLDDNRRLLAGLLAEHLPTVRWAPPAATYLAWLDCRGTGLHDGAGDGASAEVRGLMTADAGPAGAFLQSGRVALGAGSAFGTGGAGHVRLNFATSQDVLAQAVRRMGLAAAAIGAEPA
jgi:cystathionine beta-lyase